ncbi:hypothetical protein ACFODZ_06850 [Marinicella sediminis]|uniref:Uncharacterized protein n=1 Tax=Marinicella sediminis TaxID=1792834 RepID=A0ABV7J737_9GAMM
MHTEQKPTHTTIDESLEAFTPYPAYHPLSGDRHSHWCQQLMNWLKTRH